MKQLISLFLVLLFAGCHSKSNGPSSANILPDAKGDRQQFSFDMLEGTCWLGPTAMTSDKWKKWLKFQTTSIINDDIFIEDAFVGKYRDSDRVQKSTFRYKYYLSNSITSHFDENELGKRKSGRYIVEQGYHGEVTLIEIYMITPNRLYLVNKAKDTLVYTRSSEWASPYVWSDVRGKSWVETNIGAGLRRSYTFTDSLLIDSLFYSGDRKPTVSKSLYYLQDTVPAKFEMAKVGKPTSGRYIIRQENGRLTYTEIRLAGGGDLFTMDEGCDTIRRFERSGEISKYLKRSMPRYI